MVIVGARLGQLLILIEKRLKQWRKTKVKTGFNASYYTP
jgi:hypothetical protein